MGVIESLAKGGSSIVALGVTLVIGAILVIVFAVQGKEIVTDIDSTESTTDIDDLKTKVVNALGVIASVIILGVLVLLFRAFIKKDNISA